MVQADGLAHAGSAEVDGVVEGGDLARSSSSSQAVAARDRPRRRRRWRRRRTRSARSLGAGHRHDATRTASRSLAASANRPHGRSARSLKNRSPPSVARRQRRDVLAAQPARRELRPAFAAARSARYRPVAVGDHGRRAPGVAQRRRPPPRRPGRRAREMHGPIAARQRSGRAPSAAIASTATTATRAAVPRQPAWATHEHAGDGVEQRRSARSPRPAPTMATRRRRSRARRRRRVGPDARRRVGRMATPVPCTCRAIARSDEVHAHRRREPAAVLARPRRARHRRGRRG